MFLKKQNSELLLNNALTGHALRQCSERRYRNLYSTEEIYSELHVNDCLPFKTNRARLKVSADIKTDPNI